jgi:hypothetical protein
MRQDFPPLGRPARRPALPATFLQRGTNAQAGHGLGYNPPRVINDIDWARFADLEKRIDASRTFIHTPPQSPLPAINPALNAITARFGWLAIGVALGWVAAHYIAAAL